MFDRALVVTIIIVSLGIAGVIGYVLATPDEPPPAPVETPSAANGTQQREPKPPQVFERDVETIMQAWTIGMSGDKAEIIDLREAGALKFPLVVGNRVEGEVVTSKDTPHILGLVRDPYGNVILENSARKYPWGFAFSAATTGDYSLEVNTGSNMAWNIGGAHLKVTVYDE